MNVGPLTVDLVMHYLEETPVGGVAGIINFLDRPAPCGGRLPINNLNKRDNLRDRTFISKRVSHFRHFPIIDIDFLSNKKNLNSSY